MSTLLFPCWHSFGCWGSAHGLVCLVCVFAVVEGQIWRRVSAASMRWRWCSVCRRRGRRYAAGRRGSRTPAGPWWGRGTPARSETRPQSKSHNTHTHTTAEPCCSFCMFPFSPCPAADRPILCCGSSSCPSPGRSSAGWMRPATQTHTEHVLGRSQVLLGKLNALQAGQSSKRCIDVCEAVITQ